MKTYSELITIGTFEERLEYLRLYSFVGDDKFGYARHLNQSFYHSYEWQKIKNYVLLRDNFCDLAFPGMEIRKKIIVHHIIPPTITDYEQHSDLLTDPENLITVSDETHRFIHYGHEDSKVYSRPTIERKPGDTKLW